MGQYDAIGGGTGYGWKAWRTQRLLTILDHKTLGLTDVKVGEKMGISRTTVSRELNSPQAVEIGRILRKRAEGMVWPLIMKQLRQIEEDPNLKSTQVISYRMQVISILTGLLPKQIEQKIEAQTYDVEALLIRAVKQADLMERARAAEKL